MPTAGNRGATAVASDRMSDALSKLRRGELTLEEYLEFRVETAVKHLQGVVTGAQLDVVKETLRERLRNDPTILEMMRHATGVQSSGPNDD